MIVSYLGGASYKVQHGDLVVAVNPVSKDSKNFESSKYGADIVLSSIRSVDFMGVEQVTFGEKVPFQITGPGEYEYKDVFVRGLESASTYDAAKDSKRINTIYYFSIDGINLCFLGALTEKQLPAETLEGLEDIDILFVPVSSGQAGAPEGILGPKEAYALAVSLEPRVIIPCSFGHKASLEAFLKEAGAKQPQTADKLTLKKKDIVDKEGEVIVLESSK